MQSECKTLDSFQTLKKLNVNVKLLLLDVHSDEKKKNYGVLTSQMQSRNLHGSQ